MTTQLLRSRLSQIWPRATSALKLSRKRFAAETEYNTGSPQLPVVIQTSRVPVLLYADPRTVEPEAVKQLVKLAESPLPVGFVSAMPDVHVGKGVTIGTVFASENYVCPNAVGVDIGCGMCAMPLGVHKDEVSVTQLKNIQGRIKQSIPTGFEQHGRALSGAKAELDRISSEVTPSSWLEAAASEKKVAQQLGTLGGGNHFLEVVHDETGQIWVMLHSGSRYIGNSTAQHYDSKAVEFMKGRADAKLSAKDINYLELQSEPGQAYLQDMTWCQQYALSNRRLMLDILVDCVAHELSGIVPDTGKLINIHHNYCSSEPCSFQDPQTSEQFEGNLWVTRKGATSARTGQLGIIPGSMGVGSYITRGKGNSRSWNSCSHGAGRQMSRTQARKQILQADFDKAMQGIVCDHVEAVRDEAPQAYKDLTQVMANQHDLTEIVHKLQPLVNVKGFDKYFKGKVKRAI